MTGGEGELPKGWNWATFRQVARVAANLTDPMAFPDHPHVAPNHIESGTTRLLDHTTVSEDGVTSPKHRFFPGQILYSKIRPYLAKVALVDFEGLCSADMYPVTTSLDPSYLLHWLVSPMFTAHASRSQGRSVLPKINQRDLANLPVPVAPMAEQKRIVAAIEEHLSRLDAAEMGVRSSLARLRLFWSQTLAASFSEFDVSRPVGDMADVRGGIQKQPKRKPLKNTAPFLRVANVLRGRLELEEVHRIELFDGELDRYRLEAGDLLVVEGNGSPEQIGRAARWTDEVPGSVHQNHLIRVRPGPDLDPDFLDLYWNAPTTASVLREVASSTSGLYTLSTRKVKDVPVPVASMDRQRAVADGLRTAQTMVARLETELTAELARGQALRRSILAAAFSGRLVAQDRSDEPAEVLLARIAEERSLAGTKGRTTSKPSTKVKESSS